MKRRSFIQRTGLGIGSLIMSKPVLSNPNPNERAVNFNVKDYNDLITNEGEVMIRFNYSSTNSQFLQRHQGKFRVKKGKLIRIKDYFFHKEYDELDPLQPGLDIESFPWSQDVVVLWIKDGSDETSIEFPMGDKTASLTIAQIIAAKDAIFREGSALVTISYLLDREIGEIDPAEYGIREQGDNFIFTAMADPQGGNPFSHETVTTRMRIHNAFVDESVRVINELEEQPAFNIVIGDVVDGQGHEDDFLAMNKMLSKANAPTLYELGNHETKYNSTFSPGYNMSAFSNYFAAQKAFNGMDKLLYSFNLGQWHFVVWPDPLRTNFWETHPHYFYWLEQDLEKHKDRPTFFFQHIPIHPAGILPLINYAESVDVKRLLLNILSKHGNVEYVLSGHVHIPMKASVKTSVEYKGIKFINLPAAGYRPRAFGEEEFNGGPSQGIAIVNIDGANVDIHYKSVTNEQFTYPDPKPFNEKEFPLWLSHKWELASDEFRNGDFNTDLTHWFRRYVYTEDFHPSNLCEVRQTEDGEPYAYLFNTCRGYHIPGQDRLPQSINRICQVVKYKPGYLPVFKLKYWIDPDHYIFENMAGSYIWIEGFERGLKRMNVVYSNDYVHWTLGGKQSQLGTVTPVHLDISAKPGNWYDLVLNPVNDFLKYKASEKSYINQIDTIAINLGVWTLNEGYNKSAGAGYRSIRLENHELSQPGSLQSTMDGNNIQKKEQKYLWWHGIDHVAGEHQSITEDLNSYLEDL
ncbi:metallophosphoesterase family protein [Bacteroidota bacterium]